MAQRPGTQVEPLAGHPTYEKVRQLGLKGDSMVQLARNKHTGELVAIKFIPRGWEPGHTKYITREILNHQELSLSKHPHVVEFKEVFLTPSFLAEVMEYVDGATLQGFLEKIGGKLIEGLARFLFQQLALAVDFCHRKGKINRDLKLTNILLALGEGQLPLLKLADFGFSKDTYRHSEPHSQVGTALFVAPEVIQNFAGGRYDGQAADIYSCGIILFIMLFGRHPFLRPEDNELNEQQQMVKLFQRIMQHDIEYPPDVLPTISKECLDLLTNLLRIDPLQRYTMHQIQQHPWFLQALPDGAGVMNDLFLAEDLTCLSPQSQQLIEEIVYRGSMLEEEYAALRARAQLQQQQQCTSQTHYNSPSSSTGVQAPAPLASLPDGHSMTQPGQGFTVAPLQLQPPNVDAFDAMVMRIPSADLLNAAMVDGFPSPGPGAFTPGATGVHPVLYGLTGIPKTLSDLQRHINMRPPMDGMMTLPDYQPPTTQGVIDPNPFLYEGEDLPVDAMNPYSQLSIDWGSFNASFTDPANLTGVLKPGGTPGGKDNVAGSAWYKICRDISAKFTENVRQGVLSPTSAAMAQQLAQNGQNLGLGGR